jgi:acetyl esterase/lipase
LRIFGKLLAVLIAAAAATVAGLIVFPAPSMPLELAAIAVSEKSYLVGAAALVAFGLALALSLLGREPGSRTAPGIAALLATAAIGIALFPLLSAGRVADARALPLDFGRYFKSRIDSQGPGHPDRTVRYATMAGNRILAVDVYMPKERLAPSRPILVVHGGFWSAGDRGEATLASRRLADLGFTVFDVEYRTGPQPNWQAAVGDIKCAIGWVKQHARTTEWKVDPNKLTLLGRSAGGHLALVAAYAPDDPVLLPTCDVGDTTLTVDAVIALYAPTDLTWAYAHPASARLADTNARIRAFVGGTPDVAIERYRRLSPIERVTRGAPRTLLAHGGMDQLVTYEHMQRLAEKLEAVGVKYDALFIPYAQHGFDFVAGGLSGQLLEATMLQFLADTSKPAPPKPPAPAIDAGR